MLRTAIAAPLMVGALLAATVAPATANTEAAALGSSTVELVAGGTAFGAYSFPVAPNTKVSVRHYSLGPGQVISWGRTPETVVGLMWVGEVTNYLSCSSKQAWKEGHGFYFVRSKAGNTLGGVTVNETSEPAEVWALVSEAPGTPQAPSDLHQENGVPENPPVPAGGCPTGAAAAMTEIGSGITNAGGSFRTDDHQGINIYKITAAPGYSSGWHYLSDPGFLIQTKGSVEVWQNCETKVLHEQGKAYVNDSMERSQRISNSSTSPAEFLVVSFNMPDLYPPDLGPMLPELPPSGCVDTGIPR